MAFELPEGLSALLGNCHRIYGSTAKDADYELEAQKSVSRTNLSILEVFQQRIDICDAEI